MSLQHVLLESNVTNVGSGAPRGAPERRTKGRPQGRPCTDPPEPLFVAVDALAPLVALLRLDRQRRDRARLETAQRDRLAGLLAEPVGAVVDPLQRVVDLGDQLALAVARAQLDGAIGLRRSTVGEIRMILVLVLQMLKRLARLFQDVLPPCEQLVAEIVPLALIHEWFFVGRPIVLFFHRWHAPQPRTETELSPPWRASL